MPSFVYIKGGFNMIKYSHIKVFKAMNRTARQVKREVLRISDGRQKVVKRDIQIIKNTLDIKELVGSVSIVQGLLEKAEQVLKDKGYDTVEEFLLCNPPNNDIYDGEYIQFERPESCRHTEIIEEVFQSMADGTDGMVTTFNELMDIKQEQLNGNELTNFIGLDENKNPHVILKKVSFTPDKHKDLPIKRDTYLEALAKINELDTFKKIGLDVYVVYKYEKIKGQRGLSDAVAKHMVTNEVTKQRIKNLVKKKIEKRIK